MARITRRHSAVGVVAAVAIAVTGYLIYKTFPHLTDGETAEKKKEETTEEVKEEVKEDIKSDVASVKSLVDEAERAL